MRKLAWSLTLTAALLVSACSDATEPEAVAPATVEAVGDDLWRVTLTEQAATRTGIETTEVALQSIDGADRLTLPYSAVIYHYDGTAFTYTSPEPLVFLREPIDIDYIEGDMAVLNSGPAEGTTIATVGIAELYGVEFGIGK